MPKRENRLYRDLSNLEETDNYIVEGYATTFEPYLLYENDGIQFYEKMEKSAFENTDFSDVIMQYDHTGKVFARTSNKTLEITVDDKGLFIRADLSKSQASRDLYEEIKEGLITKMSWAFPSSSENHYDKETRTRVWTKIKKVYDVSAVSIPANQDTLIEARTFFDGVIEEERLELIERKRTEILQKHFKE